MIESLAEILSSPETVGAILLGTLAGLLAGLMPGISGRAGLLLVMPIAVLFGPTSGVLFLIAFHSVVHTSGSIPAILLGTPTSAAEAATAIDGYAMTRKGQGARAVGITLAASVFGGVVGAAFLFLAVPSASLLVQQVSTPEITALSVLGLLTIAALSDGRLSAGLMSASLGMLLGAVGLDPVTGMERFTFGQLELWEGLSAAALVTGLFVMPELLDRHTSPLPANASGAGIRAVLAGAIETGKHLGLLVRSSVLGVIVGLVPGLGVSSAVWIAYGHARQTHPSDVPYGEGAPAGVLAPEAANNSKEGGALVPTLILGIPASTGMGILLAAFALLGVEVGPRLLTDNPGLIFGMAWSNVLANLVAAPICLLLAPFMARVMTVDRERVTPFALAAALTAALLTGPVAATILQLAVFTGLGLAMKSAGLPRAPLMLGFILGPALESGLVRTSLIHGWDALSRPGVILILLIGLALVIMTGRRRHHANAKPDERRPPAAVPVAVAIAATLLVAGAASFFLPGTAAAFIWIAAVAGLGATLVFVRDALSRQKDHDGSGIDTTVLGIVAGAGLLAALIGLPAAVFAIVFGGLVYKRAMRYPVALLAASVAAATSFLLEMIAR